MTQPSSPAPQTASVPPPGCPAHATMPREHPALDDAAGEPAFVRLFGPEFSADPQSTYRLLRSMGPIAPVEIAEGVYGRITTTYAAALDLLRDNANRFGKSPSHWRALAAGEVPADSPALIMMMERDNALWKDGPEHTRLRTAITDSLARIDQHALRALVKRTADRLIDAIQERGEADLVADYAAPLPMAILFELFGCPVSIGERIVAALVKLFDASLDAAAGNVELERACGELAALKRATPGADVTTWLIEHPAALTDAEVIQQILLVIGAGTEPSTNLIGNALALMLADDRFAGSVIDGAQSVGGALDHVLWTDPPMANYSPLYPLQDTVYEGIWLPAGVPVLISFAAANTDPALGLGEGHRAGNVAHLAFSAGAHGCPAPGTARLIAEMAVERVLDRLPGLSLTGPAENLVRRPGTFASGWTALPVVFPPATSSAASSATFAITPVALSVESSGVPWTRSTPPAAPIVSTPQAATSTPKPPPSARGGPRRVWNSLGRWWHGR
jgi:cytochrome P450